VFGQTDFPPIQHVFGAETGAEKRGRLARLDAVKKSFIHTWESYKQSAWMADELSPLSGDARTSFGGWGATLIDSLDTLWIMEMKEDFDLAVDAINDVDFTTTEVDMLNVFETTIRYLGGLLGAYDISNGQYPSLLKKATELGDILYGAFDTPSRMPITRWFWKQALVRAQEPTMTQGIAEMGSLTLEFTRLSQLTGDNKYYDAIARVTTAFSQGQSKTSIPGLWPTLMDPKKMSFQYNTYTLSAMADSMYEYLPKQHLLLGGTVPIYLRMYDWALLVAKKHIFFRPMAPQNPDILISGIVHWNERFQAIQRDPQGQHLGCFTGGMVALAAKAFSRSQEELVIARKLVDGCIWAYDSMVTGIMPEKFHVVACEDANNCKWNETMWHAEILKLNNDGMDFKSLKPEDRVSHIIRDRRLPEGFSAIGDRRYSLRPEAIESIFVLYRVTGDRKLMDAAWRMFQAIDKHTKTKLAYAEIDDVTKEKPEQVDRMESYWTAETLKYLYLLYSDPSLVSLNEFVL
jgi:mannosyl-oligosaccharide alpha-1,2-mannosidase